MLENEEIELLLNLLSKISEEDKENFITYLIELRDNEDI